MMLKCTPSSAVSGYIPRGKFMQLFKPQFPHLQNGETRNAGLQNCCEDQESMYKVLSRDPGSESTPDMEAVIRVGRLKEMVGRTDTCRRPTPSQE